MDTEIYCHRFNIIPTLIPLMRHLREDLWSLFKGASSDDGKIVVKTGYYSRQGIKPKRESYAEPIIAAAFKAKFTAKKIFKGRNSATNERVIITLVPTSVLKQQETFNK